ncbi:MAG: RNA polymerase sigma-70 factor [Chryseolinea sp.]
MVSRISKEYLKELTDKIACVNDQDAFAKLFHLFNTRLVDFSRTFVRSREQAEEIVSDVFLKIWTNRSSLNTIGNLPSYLFIAVKNQSLNNIKVNNLSSMDAPGFNPDQFDVFIDHFSPQRELESRDLYRQFDLIIDSLPSQCQAIFRLVKVEGFRYKEAAVILNLSPRTVETQLVRAMTKLDEALSTRSQQNLKADISPMMRKLTA